MAQPDFWNNNEQAQKVIAENNILKEKRDTFVNLRDQISDLETSLELLAVEPDDDLQKDFEASFTNTQKALEQYRLTQLLDGEYDAKNAILEIHPGAGGTEAQDWGEMLLRMYIRWGEQHGFSVETASYEAGDEAGIKSVTLLIKGHNAFGYLRSEKGVHRYCPANEFLQTQRQPGHGASAGKRIHHHGQGRLDSADGKRYGSGLPYLRTPPAADQMADGSGSVP